MKKLYLVDGSGYIFRAYHALPPLRSPSGVPVGALYGFCSMLYSLTQDIHPDYLAVIFDAARKTFRQDIYQDYKAHRPETPEDLIPQFPLIRQACQAFGVLSLETEGFEADDLIASYATIAKKQGFEVVIVSSDKDLMQLVEEGISLLDPLKNTEIQEPQVFEKFGVFPSKVIDVQALAGDSSDNVPGVKGIGLKTAALLIEQFGSLEGLYENVESISQPKRRQTLLDCKELAFISKELVTLKKDVPLEKDPSSLVFDPCPSMLETFLNEQGFKALLKRIQEKQGKIAVPKAQKGVYESIFSIEKLKEVLDQAKDLGILSFDLETTSLHIKQAKIVGIALSVQEGTGYYVPVSHQDLMSEKQLSLEEVLSVLKPILTDPRILKVGHNLKYDLGVLKQYDLDLFPLHDTLLMSYVLDIGLHGHGMDELSRLHLDYETITFSQVAGTGKNQKTFDQVDVQTATTYAAEDADITLRLYTLFSKRLKDEKLLSVYERYERPLVEVIASMEDKGVLIDEAQLKSLKGTFTIRQKELEEKIYAHCGELFNIASPKQLGEVLFEKLKLPVPKKTKTGAYVTDADVLEKLSLEGHEIATLLLQWRGVFKLLSTYVEGLQKAINPKSHRVHTTYSLSATSTGRLASSDPNLQNIPIRQEDGRLIRKAFIAPKGYKIVSFDYSQIELRLLAHVAQIETLIHAFKSKEDCHTLTASQVFNVPKDQVTSDLRRKAKAINFGIIYGISAYGLSQQLGISTSEASFLIKAYFERYPGIQAYMEAMKQEAKQKGCVTTPFQRRLHIPGILDKNPGMRQFSERQAINAPLQGGNADLIKLAMIQVHHKLKSLNLKTTMLLQVHDELVFEIPESELDQVVPLIQGIMENVEKISVPLEVGVGIGNNWDEAH
ncbi:MAG TPA: DNA polymerase I [Alphaproteobacteria bacterium]|nr:DNA polymerase I [Alphaproteobacteria bacterium]